MSERHFVGPLPVTLSQLRDRVIELDTALISQGRAPYQRPFAVSITIAKELKVQLTGGAAGRDPLTEAVHGIYRELYRVRDLALPPVHVGVFMFRDVFFRVFVPLVYGIVTIRPLDLVDDMSETQKRWMASEPADLHRFLDQVIDLFDFCHGLDDFSKIQAEEEEAVSLLKLGRAHLEAAANACVGSVDPYAVVQNALIAAELLLKGALRAVGSGEKELKAIGHNLVPLCADFCARHPSADRALMQKVCASLPHVVTQRYRRLDLSRAQIGNIVMQVQYLSGEIMRQLADRSLRQALRMDHLPPPIPRTFPA